MALSHHQWDPAQYLRYGNERLRPALDLLDHVAHQAPLRVVDLGCGTGQLCDLMKHRWPTAEVLGLDGSDTMLSTARDSYPGCRFELADIQHWQARAEFDVIFSNAAFQWLPDHQRLFPDLLKGISAELKRRMQGKTCWNFKKAEEPLFVELAEVVDASFQRFAGLGERNLTRTDAQALWGEAKSKKNL